MRRRGQMVVEFALVLPFVFVIFLIMNDAVHVLEKRRQVLSMARLGAALQSRTHLSDEFIRDYLDQRLREMDSPSSMAWSLATGPYRETPASRFYSLVKTKIDVTLARAWGTLRFSDEVIVQKEGD